MNLQVAFRHMDPSVTLKEYANKKLDRLERLSEKLTDVHVTFAQEKLDTTVEFMANLHGQTIKAVERDNDPYAATDLAIDKFERQIVRIRQKLRDRKHAPRPPMPAQPESTLESGDDDF